MQMPKMDGLTLARAIRAQSDYGKRVPLIMLTSLGRSESLDAQLHQIKFQAFLNKPIRQSNLHNVLTQVLTGTPVKQKVSKRTAKTVAIDRTLGEKSWQKIT